MQFSIFLVDGRPASFVRLRATLQHLIDPDVDSIMYCDLGPRETTAARAISYAGSRRRVGNDEDAFIL